MSKSRNKKDLGKYRSHFEMEVAKKMPDNTYEIEEISYEVPAKTHKYKPDFTLTDENGNKTYIEVKGRFRSKEEADKYLNIRSSNENIDLRFIIMDKKTLMPNCKKTTIAEWLKKNGFVYYIWPDIPKKIINMKKL